MRIAGAGVGRTCLILVACLSLIVVAGACGTALPTPAGGQSVAASPTVKPEPTPTYDSNEFALTPVLPVATKWPQPPTPGPIPTHNPNVCDDLNISATFGPPPTAEQFAHWYGLIVTGTVTQVLPAQWSTPDGKRPANNCSSYSIITPAILKLDGAPLVSSLGADVTAGVLVVSTFGGTVGNNVMTINDQSQHLEVGQHILVGLSDHDPYAAGHARYSAPAGPTWTVGTVYLLTDDGKAVLQSSNGGSFPTVDAQAFMAAIIKAAANQP